VADTPIRRIVAVDPATIDSFATALDRFADTLDDREFAILQAIVEDSLPPLARMRRRPADEILTPAEREILTRLKVGGGTP
jgi:hypothetical protein